MKNRTTADSMALYDQHSQMIFDWLLLIGPATPRDLSLALDLDLPEVNRCLGRLHRGGSGCVTIHSTESRLWGMYNAEEDTVWVAKPGAPCNYIDTTPVLPQVAS